MKDKEKIIKKKVKEEKKCVICGEKIETFGLKSVDQSLCWNCRRDQDHNG